MLKSVEIKLKKFDLVTLSLSLGQLKELEFFCKQFSFAYKNYENIDSISKPEETAKIVVIGSNLKNLSAEVQSLKYFYPDSLVLALIDEEKISEAEIPFLKKSGVDLVYNKGMLESSSIVQYAILSIVKFYFNPIKVNDLIVNKKTNFDAFIFLPANDKTIKVLNSDTIVDEPQIQRLKKFNELFVKRKDLENFREYKKDQNIVDNSIRSKILLNKEYYTMFVLNLFNLLKSREEISNDLTNINKHMLNFFDSLKKDKEVSWNNFDQSLDYQFGPIDHILNYFYIASKLVEFTPCNEPMLVNSILLFNLGQLKLNFRTFQKVKKQSFDFDALEKNEYTKYPLSGLNIFLNNKITINADIQKTVLFITEQFDRQGFPYGPQASSKIPIESKVVRLSKILNDDSLIKTGGTQKTLNESLKGLIEKETKEGKIFSPDFLLLYKDLLIA